MNSPQMGFGQALQLTALPPKKVEVREPRGRNPLCRRFWFPKTTITPESCNFSNATKIQSVEDNIIAYNLYDQVDFDFAMEENER